LTPSLILYAFLELSGFLEGLSFDFQQVLFVVSKTLNAAVEIDRQVSRQLLLGNVVAVVHNLVKELLTFGLRRVAFVLRVQLLTTDDEVVHNVGGGFGGIAESQRL
jgi:hypothetical protein